MCGHVWIQDPNVPIFLPSWQSGDLKADSKAAPRYVLRWPSLRPCCWFGNLALVRNEADVQSRRTSGWLDPRLPTLTHISPPRRTRTLNMGCTQAGVCGRADASAIEQPAAVARDIHGKTLYVPKCKPLRTSLELDLRISPAAKTRAYAIGREVARVAPLHIRGGASRGAREHMMSRILKPSAKPIEMTRFIPLTSIMRSS